MHEGTITAMRINRDIREKVTPTQKEMVLYGIKTEFDPTVNASTITWNDKGQKSDFNITFTEFETQQLKGNLKKLDEQGKMNEELLRLVDLFDVQGK